MDMNTSNQSENDHVNVTGNLGPGEIITVEYQGGMLRLKFPIELWTAGYNRLMQTAALIGKPKQKYVCKAVAQWIFMLAFDWIREFPVSDMTGILETNRECLAYTNKILGNSGLCHINKQGHYKNQFMRLKGTGYYEWTPVMPFVLDVTNGLYDRYDYCIENTPFHGMLEKYVECRGLDEYVPEKQGGWGVLDKSIYESPYYDLTYRFSGTTFKARLFECYWVHTAVSRFGRPPVYKYRLYNGFHYLPGILRKNVYYKGDNITELFDLHCSFYTISAGVMLEKYPDIDRDVIERFYWDCALGRLYDKCADYLSCTRDEAKDRLQGWRNLSNRGVAHAYDFGYSGVSKFMENTYPEISDIYYDWPTYVNSDGKTKKALQRDLSEYETRLMSKLAYEIEGKYGVKCFLLHDAIFVSVKDKAEKLPVDIENKIFNWFRINILK